MMSKFRLSALFVSAAIFAGAAGIGRNASAQVPRSSGGGLEQFSARGRIEQKLQEIVIPKIDLDNATVEEAVARLRKLSYELDPETAPRKKGVNLIVRSLGRNKTKISLHLEKVSLGGALKAVTSKAGFKYKVGSYAVEINELISAENPKE